MDSTISTPAAGKARKLLWLGIAFAIVGVPLYVLQLTVIGRTDSPWYMPFLTTLGVGMVVLALRRRPNLCRGLMLLLVVALAGFEWWFLVRHVRLPAYTGPVAAGESFPEFRAIRADGTGFTQTDFVGDRDTALVFFRGHW